MYKQVEPPKFREVMIEDAIRGARARLKALKREYDKNPNQDKERLIAQTRHQLSLYGRAQAENSRGRRV